MLLDLIQPSTGYIKSNDIQVNTSENWKTFTGSFLDESFLIGYLTPEEYFYFIGDLRHQNKADIDALLQKHEEFFNREILKNTCVIFQKEIRKKWESLPHLLAIQKW